MMRNVISISTLVLVLLIFTLPAISSTYLIQPDGTGDYADVVLAMDAAVDGDTILLADGTYTGRGNRDIQYNGKQVVIGSQSGNPENCIIDVEGEFNDTAERGFIFNSDEGSSSVLRDIKIVHGNADAPCPECEGGGVYIDGASPTIENLILEDNYAANGGGIMVNGGSPVIKDCLFINNDAYDGGGFMCLTGDNPVLDGCVFFDNTATLRGAAISGQSGPTIEIVSCTIANNTTTVGSAITAWECDYLIDNSIIAYNGDSLSVWSTGESEITIQYTDVYGNTGGDWVGPIEGQGESNGNMNEDPLFLDIAERDYQLTFSSPCIDQGNPALPYDPDNTIADMGAYYYDQIISVDDVTTLPKQTVLKANYPNPFNAQTVISFELSSRADVQLDIYDILGRKVISLIDDVLDAGQHQVVWHADVATGVYFYRLKTDDYISQKKMLLMK